MIARLALERQTALLEQADALDSKAATLVVLFPRRYRINPEVGKLTQRFMRSAPEDTFWAITQSVNRALPQIQGVLARKAFLVGVATLMLVAALGMIGGRLIYSIEREPAGPATMHSSHVRDARR